MMAPNHDNSDFAQAICSLCVMIPKKYICTYGILSAAAGFPAHARHVAGVLKLYSEEKQLPWHRVVNVQGRVSIAEPYLREIQIRLLQGEGHEIDLLTGKINQFKNKLWLPELSWLTRRSKI